MDQDLNRRYILSTEDSVGGFSKWPECNTGRSV